VGAIGTSHGPWGNEQVNARFAQLFAENVSFANMSAMLESEFGIKVSRNACIGRAARIFPRRLKMIGPQKPRAPRVRKPAKRPVTFTEKPRPAFKCDPVELSKVNADALHLSIVDLGAAQCRYPFGDGPITFCGLKAFDGQSYCELHYAVTHVPIRGTDRHAAWSAEKVAA